jgi:PAS domain S-box-containing protein
LTVHTNIRSSEIEEKTSRNLSRLYIIALTAVALLTITGQILIQYHINDQLSDSHVANLAGRQRYKSQQICKMALIVYSDLDHPQMPDKKTSLKKLLEEWKQGHDGLQHGSKALHLPGNNSKKVQAMFSTLDPYFQQLYSSANIIINLKESGEDDTVKSRQTINKLLANENYFLEGMDAIVHQYEAEALERVFFLKKFENILLSLTLLILLLEGIFVFRPAVLTIKRTIRGLLHSEEKASNMADQVMIANRSLEKSLKDLKDINFALEHATILAKTDRYGVITYVNDEFCDIAKYSREELIGNRFQMLSGHYHSKQFFDKMWESISSGKIWNDEIKNKAKDSSPFWLDTTIVPIMGDDGVPASYIGIYVDITQKFKQSINEQKIRSASLIEGQEKERKKIARELHDGLGQMLTALKFNIEGIKGAASKREKTRLDEIKKMVTDTIGEVRRISFNLMPSVLSDFGITSAVKDLSEQVSKASKVNVVFDNNSSINRLNKTTEINLYRIVQEGLNNAIKYAEADEVRIILSNNEESLNLTIADNGKGFNSKKIGSNGKPSSSGNGITNIQERTSLINGEFKIETAPGMGTKIFIKVPFKLN